jgi:hypothetical protein
MVTLLIGSVLTGCPAADRHANLFPSHWRVQRWTDQLAANRRSTASGNASPGGPSVVGAGSFLRSLLIPGTRYLDPDRPLQSTLA